MKRPQASGVSGLAQSGWQGALAGITAFFLIVTVFLSACTTYRPIEDDPDALQQRIRAAKALRQGDHVRVVTRDGVSHWLTVLSAEDDVLKGQLDNTEAHAPAPIGDFHAETPQTHQESLAEIPIRDIVFVEKEQVSVGWTAAAVAGGAAAVLFVFILISL